jgi:predicted ferric reductase
VPEGVADRVNRECTKWLLLLAVITLFVLIFGVIYGVRTSNYYTIPFTILPILLGLFILLGVGAYIYSWYLLQQRNKRKG